MTHESFMKLAIQEAWKATPSEKAYSVGAVIVHGNQVIATGYSREMPGNTHAEEVCLLKLNETPSPCTLYSTMEPCSHRLSRKESCAERIIHSGLIDTVVVGVLEPKTFVQDCIGIQMLKDAQIKVIFLSQLQGSVFDIIASSFRGMFRAQQTCYTRTTLKFFNFTLPSDLP